jgi:peptide deformylase
MKIITVPHSTLRAKALPIKKVDTKLKQFVKGLGQTLEDARNPRGVGLAAPQVDKKWRILTTYLSPIDGLPAQSKIYINPTITKESKNQILGLTAKDRESREEGCLSMPGLYGPVPRFEWIELTYDKVEGDGLIKQTIKLNDFEARVVQHEIDHLDGILFTDYSLEFNLPVFGEMRPGKFEEVERSILESF